MPRGHEHTAPARGAERSVRAAVGRDPVARVQSHTVDRSAVPVETAVSVGSRLGPADVNR